MARDPSTYRSARREQAKTLARTGLLPFEPVPRAPLRRTKVFIGSAALALVVALVIAAGAFAGVISMIATHVCLTLAWIVAAISLSAAKSISITPSKSIAFGAVLLIFFLSAVAFFGLDRWIDSARSLDLTEGLIVAHNDVESTDKCSTYPLDLKAVIHIGATTIVTNRFPHTIVSLMGRNILYITRSEGGEIEMNAEIFDQSGDILASIKRNYFHINKNKTFYAERKDPSSLVVFDRHNEQVLSFRFMNDKEMRITGTLFYGASVRVSDTELSLPGNGKLQSGCFINNGTDLFIN